MLSAILIHKALWKTNNNLFEASSDILSLAKERDLKILLIGDSIIAHGSWEKHFDKLIINAGKRGDMTSALQKRLSSMKLNEFSAVYLMIGVNDLRHGDSVLNTAQNMNLILHDITEQINDVVVFSVLPVSKNYKKTSNKNIAKLNDKYRSLAQSLGVRYVDLAAIYSKDNALSTKFSYDGLHLNSKAYHLWYMIMQGELTRHTIYYSIE